jgi:hypothetical protein
MARITAKHMVEVRILDLDGHTQTDVFRWVGVTDDLDTEVRVAAEEAIVRRPR